MESVFLQLINLSLAVGMVILLAALVRPLLVRRYRRALLRGIWAVLAVRLLLPVSLPAAAVEMELPASLGQPVAARVAAPLPGGESESIQSGGQELPVASQENAATVPASLPAASPLELAALVWLTGGGVDRPAPGLEAPGFGPGAAGVRCPEAGLSAGLPGLRRSAAPAVWQSGGEYTPGLWAGPPGGAAARKGMDRRGIVRGALP